MFVLRRYDRNPELSFLFASYTESVTSTKTEFNGKVACTIFLENPNSVRRALNMGWIDETDEYNEHVQMEYQKIENEKIQKTTKSKTTKTKGRKRKATKKD